MSDTSFLNSAKTAIGSVASSNSNPMASAVEEVSSVNSFKAITLLFQIAL